MRSWERLEGNIKRERDEKREKESKKESERETKGSWQGIARAKANQEEIAKGEDFTLPSSIFFLLFGPFIRGTACSI